MGAKSRLWTALLLIAGIATMAAWLSHAQRRAARITEQGALAEVIRRVDTDGDGRISAAEWKAIGGGPQIFEGYDLNGDGYLDADEVELLFETLDPRPHFEWSDQ